MGVDVGLGSYHTLDIDRTYTTICICMGYYRVPGVNPALVRMLDQRERFVLVQHPVLPLLRAIRHGAQDDLGDLEARVAQSDSS